MSNLYKHLKEYKNSDFYPFHMPGHKRNNLLPVPEEIRNAFGIDITEIDGFDNLHHAAGLIMEVQKKAAGLYGADETFLLVNGSTCGVLSAIMSAVGKRGRLLLARNSHKSAYHAAYLGELAVDYLYPQIVEEYGFSDGILPQEIENMLKEKPETEAVFITSPTYEGVVSDIREIAKTVHKYGKILIVDEAHGAHFGFYDKLPETSVKLGADIVIHSLHKTLPAMGQSALLHIKGSRVDRERLRRYLKIFQTSSPSYVMMTSIDICMEFMQTEGKERLKHMLQYRSELLRKASVCSKLELVTLPAGKYHMKEMDPGKLIISVRRSNITARELYDILRENYHLQPEMAVFGYVLLIVTAADREEGFNRLTKALIEIDAGIDFRKRNTAKHQIIRPEQIIPISKALDSIWEFVPLNEIKEKTAAEFINLYPPGIPLVVPGEKLDEKVMDYIKLCRKEGLDVQGTENDNIKVLK